MVSCHQLQRPPLSPSTLLLSCQLPLGFILASSRLIRLLWGCSSSSRLNLRLAPLLVSLKGLHLPSPINSQRLVRRTHPINHQHRQQLPQRLLVPPLELQAACSRRRPSGQLLNPLPWRYPPLFYLPL
jgi:hypothetical protein